MLRFNERYELNFKIFPNFACRPTFYRIIKRKSTEGFQSFPYLVALFSSMLWIYYASLKPNAYLLISINTVGCVVETIYIALYIAYAPKKARVLSKLPIQLLFLRITVSHNTFLRNCFWKLNTHIIFILNSYSSSDRFREFKIKFVFIIFINFADVDRELLASVQLWGIFCGGSFLPLPSKRNLSTPITWVDLPCGFC